MRLLNDGYRLLYRSVSGLANTDKASRIALLAITDPVQQACVTKATRGLAIMTKPFETQAPGAPGGARHREIYGRYEKLYTLNDFLAALYFLVGSGMFLYESLQIPATWGFIIGSVHFMLRPTIKIAREFHLANLPLPGDDG